jgi:DNA replication protein DnaC
LDPPLAPSSKSRASLEFQAGVIDLIKSHPASSFVFCGPAGHGKTFMVNRLYRLAMIQTYAESVAKKTFLFDAWNKSVFRSHVADLLEEHQAWSTRGFDESKPVKPSITNEKIRTCPFRPRVFLTEFGRIGNATDTRQKVIFGILDAVNDYYGQLVVDSNLTPKEIEDIYGEKDMRRMRQMAWFVNYFDSKITPPMEEEEVTRVEV